MKELVSITQAHRASRRIAVTHPLPAWISPKDVKIHIPHTLQLMDLAGVRRLNVSGTGEESLLHQPAIVGVDKNGTAVAGRTSTKEKSIDVKSETIFPDDTMLFMTNAIWQDVSIKYNRADIDRTITHNNEDPRNPAAWAKRIDSTVRYTLIRQGLEHYFLRIHTNPVAHLFLNGIPAFVVFTNMLMLFKQPENVGYNIAPVAFNELVYNVLFGNLIGLSKNGEGYRPNVFVPGYEIDRAALLIALAGTRTIIQEKKK